LVLASGDFLRDALLLFAEEKSESEGESQSREESINRNTTEDRYRNRVIRPFLSFFKKAEEKKRKKNKAQSSIDRERRRRRKRRRENVPWQKGQRKITVGVRTREKEENAWSASRPRVARAFSKSTKNFSYQNAERGPPLVSSL
jgi:hypothetical protein